MSIVLENGMTIRLFGGCLLTTEMRAMLDKSHKWKEAQIVQQEDDKKLVILHHQGKEHLGVFVNHIEVTIPEIEKIEEWLKSKISNFCPDYDIAKIKILMFPQVFIK